MNLRINILSKNAIMPIASGNHLMTMYWNALALFFFPVKRDFDKKHVVQSDNILGEIVSISRASIWKL